MPHRWRQVSRSKLFSVSLAEMTNAKLRIAPVVRSQSITRCGIRSSWWVLCSLSPVIVQQLTRIIRVELHQLNSPETAYDFLNDLLDGSSQLENIVSEATIFSDYLQRSVVGIVRSRGIV